MILLALACASCAPLPDAVAVSAPCSATDGDTIRCGDERIRLLAIDAPELAGHCREGRRCAAGDPVASQASLAMALQQGPIRIIRLGEDRYGRTLGSVMVGSNNLSCLQLKRDHAIYVRKWDNRRAIAAACPAAAR